MGSGRIRGTRGDETFELASLTIQAFPVAHDDYLQDPVLGHHFQGYAVSDGQVTVAHVGDARADDLLTARVAAVAPDLLCLPVNGRDDDRRAMGFAGNMNAEEAFELAKQAGARLRATHARRHVRAVPQRVGVREPGNLAEPVAKGDFLLAWYSAPGCK